MALVRTRIFSIVDSEFDRVFDGSIGIMTDPTTGTYPFAELGLTELADQKAYIRQHCEDMIASDNAFCFKTEDSGLLLTMVFGTVANSQLELYWWLGADDASGSRSYVYDKANVLSFHTWLKEQGVTTIRSHITERSTRLKDFTDDGATRIQAEAGDWGVSEVDATVGTTDSAFQTKYANVNFRKLTMNSNANLTVDDD